MHRPLVPTLVFSTLLAASPSLAADWPQWRGPGRDGVAPGFQAPAAWPAAPTKLWSIEVGPGHSGPAVAGGRVFVHARQGDDEVVAAHDLATGKQLWRDAYPAAFAPKPEAARHGKGPFATPTVADGRVFAYGVNGVLDDLVLVSGEDLDTQALRVTRREGRFAAEKVWGNRAVSMYMSSPVLAGGLLYGFSTMRKGHLFALDPKSGAVRWQTEGGQGDHASLIAAGDVLLVLHDTADLRVVAASGEAYRQIARYGVADAATWAHPAAVSGAGGGRLLVKDAARLTLWGFAAAPRQQTETSVSQIHRFRQL